MAGGDDSAEAGLALELMNRGAELTAGVVGGFVGSVGGPAGVIGGTVAGVATGRAFQRIGAEVQQRLFAPRQHMRAGAAFAFAAEAVSARVMMGDLPRSDGFFGATAAGRSPAEELLEGTLAAASDAYEERKVRFLGWLYASLVFDVDVSRAYANLMIRQADQLRFRQLCFMAIVWEHDYATLVDMAVADGVLPRLQFSDDLALDVDELERLGLVGRGEPGATHKRGGATFVDAGSLAISDLTLTGAGKRLCDLMNLHKIAAEDRVAVLQELIPATVADPGD